MNRNGFAWRLMCMFDVGVLVYFAVKLANEIDNSHSRAALELEHVCPNCAAAGEYGDRLEVAFEPDPPRPIINVDELAEPVVWMTPNGEKPAHAFTGNTLLPCCVCGAELQHAVHHDAVVR